MSTTYIVVSCRVCLHDYTADAFRTLEFCGLMIEDDLEIRHCSCGNTISAYMTDLKMIGYSLGTNRSSPIR